MRNIVIKLKKSGSKVSEFSIKDNYGNILIPSISKETLIIGKHLSIEDNVVFLTLASLDKRCPVELKLTITTVTNIELASMDYTVSNTASLWKHLTDTTIYNKFYGTIYPYVIEHPFSYTFNDEIIQNVKDYTKAFEYLPSINGVFDSNRRVQSDGYFNKAIVYNDEDSSGLLYLVAKPKNNMKEVMSYPKYHSDGKSILVAKSDNFYQYNTFWSIVKDRSVPLFNLSCESLSIDKLVNDDNMDYSTRSFRKAPIRGKDVKVRHILDDKSDLHLVSQFIITPSQLSYK